MHEARWRLTCFVGVLVVMAIAEALLPRRPRLLPRTLRWSSHAALVVLNTVATRFLIPVTAVQAAIWASNHSLGLLNQISLPRWMEFLLAVVLLDLGIYGQHVLFHRVPSLWKLHKVHHADLDLDVTSGIRFHTLEIILSAIFKVILVVLVGPSVLAVVVFEILLNAGSLWSHSNVRIPESVDRRLRLVLVTPDMHRVHHSVIPSETNSNFGFHIPWWDYLFGTYQAQPQAGHDAMTIGLESPRDPQQVAHLPGILTIPFIKDHPAG